ncbi:thioester-containing protein 1 allele R1 [Zeugodacus cucurbitae]|uniref:thioester-containing protein 1 allele R1 n=1 Tax=Zeugodacus cucurbitae TaxID=28588 RepID=UPI0023D8F275|nr:thioester-containing protein 1 allele R1 [Zeugodacus cucurbitae]
MVKLAELLPILGLLIVGAQAKGYYTITSPDSIRPNSKYSVHVSVSDVQENSRISLTLQGPQYNKFTEIVVPPNSGQSATFDLGDITNGAYSLKAKGLSGIIFENSTNLEFVENPPMVLLQTDKGMYKFGETIQFRAVFLDQYLLPAKVSQQISLVLKDSQNTTIERFDDVVLDTGVYKGKINLAEQVTSGIWSLQVFLGQNMLTHKTIDVKQYDLPLFEVDLDLPSHVSLREKEFIIKVKAYYTFGKPIFGTCALAFNVSRDRTVRKQFNLEDGQLEITIKTRELGARLRPIPIDVEVADIATQTSRKISKTIIIVANHYRISTPDVTHECSGQDETFLYRAQISQSNGKPINTDREVYVTIDARTKDDVTTETILAYAEENGNVDVEIECGNNANINVTIKYDNAQSTGVVQLYHQDESGEGGIYVKTQFPTVNEQMEVRLITPEAFTSFVCMIVGRGNIVYSNVIKVPNGGWTQAHTFSVTPTHEMMPDAHIFAYFFKNGKMFYYETTFSVINEFKNTISIDANEVVKPGTFIQLSVDTEPNSYVGLLGMDKSVLLLKEGNDFNAKAIFDDLRHSLEKSKISGRHGPGIISGLVTMTNAHYIENKNLGELGPVNQRSNKPIIRRNFFETFAFFDFTSEDGHDEIQQKIPDTITTWVITGFSLNPKTGFTLTTTPTHIRTFLNFFVTLKLPQSVKLGEIIELEATIFNYSPTNVRASVTLETQNDEFEFFSNPNDKKHTVREEVTKERTKTVKFKIRPKVVGMITLKITAQSMFVTDVIVKKLKVEHEGIPVFENKDFFIKGDESKPFRLDIPQNIVPGSEHIEISVRDFVMGSMLNLINNGENFDQLITSPTGCGEQNMVRLVPNLMVLKYLQSTSASNQAIVQLAKSHLQIGYQRELTYKVSDYSYSTWGGAPGNTWLTSYVIRIFNEAKSYIYVDENIIKNGLNFLRSKQEADGSFREDGSLYDFVTLNKLSVTASVVLTFLENKQYLDQYKKVIDDGIKYITANVKQNNDMRAKALSLYVLHLRNDPMVEELLNILETKAKTSGDHKWWQHTDSPANIDVYVTGYILMTMIELNKPVTPIIKWIVSKRNSNGGFASTFETEVGLRALSIYAARYREHGSTLEIDVFSHNQLMHTFKVGDKNKDINKIIELPKNTRELQFTAAGSGTATFQISYHYNTLEPQTGVFTINSTIIDPNAPRKTLQVCMQLVGQKIEKSNMAILEIGLPTSDEVDPNCCDVKLQKQAKKIVRRSKQQIHVYFEGIKKDDSDCVDIPMLKQFDVDNQKPAGIVIYDYYEKNSVDKYFYQV